ncbi:hypothetical protein PQ460_00225 [Paenibacillus sp. KACC 21273]|uniref:hypothetical protein n=1 Tax=Paenibacillus sp. KACC 21273 TaxID=3025665 RepID=UPI0023657D6B|nr:hypothetical protein [Paenibacillus sp. KACC 21273]WDF50914.1 hypothetical protein PQ460_00225 [Paenibacillus sp. KACC 21273]
MGLPKHKESIDSIISGLLDSYFKKGVIEGYDRGYDEGYEDGYEQRKCEDKPALSEGLRKGSSKCGKTMAKMKKNKKNYG